MKIGFVGLGKLGMPCALAAAVKHDVMGYDCGSLPKEILRTKQYPYQEKLAQFYLDRTTLTHANSIDQIVQHSDIIFCAVQTPHAPLYEGITRLPETRADFDYSFLCQSVKEIAQSAQQAQKHILLSVISTVLPGTCEREIYPLLNSYIHFAYNPFFIAMGTTIPDYLNPEFILLGSDDAAIIDQLANFYDTLTSSPTRKMSVKSAELTKVIYNTFIGMKIAIANTVMEICERNGGNCDDVMTAIGSATDRIISPKYLRSGMGDGGGCHPRDNIALSWISQKLQMKYDLFQAIMQVRECQTDWLADILIEESKISGLPIVLLGKAFKTGTNLSTGSPAILLHNLLQERGIQTIQYDPIVGPQDTPPNYPAVYFIATNHQEFQLLSIPQGSIVIDPWGDAPVREGVITKWIGRNK